MAKQNLSFAVSQIEDKITFAGDPGNFKAGNAVWWSMPSFKNNGEHKLGAMEKDGGHWRGQVNILPDGAFNMVATWFPVDGGQDSIQVVGPVLKEKEFSHVSIVGGTGKYAGARGEAKSTVAMSDSNTPIFIYELSFSV